MKQNTSTLFLATVMAAIAVPFTFAPAALASENTQTLTDTEQNQQLAGAGGGAVIGGLVAGPAGALVGGVISVLFVDKHQSAKRYEQSALEESQQAETIEQELAHVSANLSALQMELDVAQQRAEELRAHATELGRQRDLLRSIEHEVRFETDTYELAEADLARLLQLSSVVAQLPDSEVRLEGYADVRGDDDYNEALSLDRAYAVADAMNTFGVAQKQIRTYAFGESESTAVDQASLGQDRRVSIQFAPTSGEVAEQEIAARLQRVQRYAASRRAHVCETDDAVDNPVVAEMADASDTSNAPMTSSASKNDAHDETKAVDLATKESTHGAFAF